MSETKHDKFLRLSESRGEKAVAAILVLRNLASSNYESSEEERVSVVQRLRDAVDEVGQAYGVTQDPVAVAEQPAPAPKPKPQPRPGSDVIDKSFTFGPEIGRAMEAVKDGKSEEALEILRGVMTA